MPTPFVRMFVPALLAIVAAAPAFAHTGLNDGAGFSHGFSHPFGGIDHVLAMVAVGMFAAQLGGRALWLVPLTFVLVMAAGGALGVAGLPIPFVEMGIAASVLALGVAIATGLTVPVALATALVGLFAMFHGYAHGAEMPDTASGLAFGVGFIAATALLHVSGIGLGLAARSMGGTGRRAARLGGGLMALAGLGLLAGWM